MENKKLINILLKDMQELEKLIAEIKDSGKFNLLEMEILQAKASGIKQLIGILKNRAEEIPEPAKILNQEVIHAEKEPEPEETEPEPVVEVQEEKAIISEEIEHEPVHEVEEPEEEPQAEPVETADEEMDEPSSEEEVSDAEEEEPQPENEEPVKEVIHEEPVQNSDEEVELEDPEENEQESRVLGDKFLKSNSVNDLVSGNGKLEHKLSSMPVSSIRSAIGINDRFLYTRELFDGNADKFTEAVTKLDNLNNISEAVSYLRNNFKWRKNETSLKFIDLVKRRFLNE